MTQHEPRHSTGEPSPRRGIDLARVREWATRHLPQSAARRLNPALAVVRDSALEAQRAHLTQMAAALAFKTIFSLIPAIVLAMVLLQVFLLRGETPEKTRANVAEVVRDVLTYAGISQITVAEPADMGPFLPGSEPPAAGTAPPPDPAAPSPSSPAPGASQAEGLPLGSTGSPQLDDWIVTLVMRVSEINFGAIGVIGLIGLIYAAISLLVEIEHAFNQVYRVPTGRSWVRRVTQYWTLLTLGTLGVVATFTFGIQAVRWVGQRASDVTGISAGDHQWLNIISAYGLNIVISTALFLLVYTVVPNAKVRLGAAFVGAAVAAVLWEAGKWGLTLYLKYSTGYTRLYGSIALLLIFFVWIHASWTIVLLGLSISYYLQHGRTKSRPVPEDAQPAIVDPSATVSLVARICRDFESGTPPTAIDLARELRLQPALASAMLLKLEARGILHRVADAEAPDPDHPAEPRYAPSRPAERLDAAEVLRVGEEMADPGLSSTSPVVAAMREARLRLASGRSIADFMPRATPKQTPAPAIEASPAHAT